MRTFTQRLLDFVGFIAPGVMLALMPKCPVCLASYVAIATGIGLSVTAAANLRLLLVLLCLGSLFFVAIKYSRRALLEACQFVGPNQPTNQ